MAGSRKDAIPFFAKVVVYPAGRYLSASTRSAERVQTAQWPISLENFVSLGDEPGMSRKANDQILRTAWFCRLRTYGRDPTWQSALTVRACAGTAESRNTALSVRFTSPVKVSREPPSRPKLGLIYAGGRCGRLRVRRSTRGTRNRQDWPPSQHGAGMSPLPSASLARPRLEPVQLKPEGY